MGLLLTLTTGKQTRSWEIDEELTLGRGRDCAVRLRHKTVADEHARILFNGGKPILQALGECEVTLNGELIDAAELKAGDVVGIGPYELSAVNARHPLTLPIAAGVVALLLLLGLIPVLMGGSETKETGEVADLDTKKDPGQPAVLPDFSEPAKDEAKADEDPLGLGDIPPPVDDPNDAPALAAKDPAPEPPEAREAPDSGKIPGFSFPEDKGDKAKGGDADKDKGEDKDEEPGIDLAALRVKVTQLLQAGQLAEAKEACDVALRGAKDGQRAAVEAIAQQVDTAIAKKDEADWAKRREEIAAAVKARETWEADVLEIQELAEYLEHDQWSFRAIGAVALAAKSHRRATGKVAPAVDDKTTQVRAFVLKGLLQLPVDEIKHCEGGLALVEAVIDGFNKNGLVKAYSKELLSKIAGEELSSKYKAKKWLDDHKEEFVPKLPNEPDLSGFRREELARYEAERRKEAGASGGGMSTVLRGDQFKSALEDLRKDGLDVCIVLDVTGSMGGVLAEAKDKVETLSMILSNLVGNFRIGLVTFRDEIATTVPLTKNWGVFKKALDAQQASGGGDGPEGVEKGVEVALVKGGWRKDATKAVVIVGDAPPHAEDLPRFDELADACKKVGVVIHGLYTRAVVPEIDARVKRTGGDSATLASDTEFLKSFLLLIFGKDLEPYLQAFLKIYLEVAKDLKG